MTTKLKEYDSPPIVEVAIGLKFQRVEKLSAPYFGLFWGDVHDLFPNAQQVSPNVTSGGDLNLSDLPIRCWYTSADQHRLLQLQRDSFYFNWRKTVGDESDGYPEWSKLWPEFQSYHRKLEDFFVRYEFQSLAPTEYEVSYVNFIPYSEMKPHLANPPDVLLDHKRSYGERFLEPPKEFQWTSVYPLPDSLGDLVVSAASATNRTGSREPFIRLELSARGPANADLHEWFRIAHEQIVFGFTDLTDLSIQRNVWGLKK